MVGRVGQLLHARGTLSCHPGPTLPRQKLRRLGLGWKECFLGKQSFWDQKLVSLSLKGSSLFPKSSPVPPVAAETPDKQTVEAGVPQVRLQGSDSELDR